MKNNLLQLALYLMLPFGAWAQYSPMDTLQNVEVSYRWAAETWYKPKSDRVLLVRTINRNDFAVEYEVEIIISRDGVVLETSPAATYCIRPRGLQKGRLNGIVMKPLKLTGKDIRDGNYELSIELTSAEKTEKCEPLN